MSGVIVAGGRATRMGGGDKGMLALGGKPLATHVIRRLSPQVRTVALNANGPVDVYRSVAAEILPDVVGGFPGPLAGILTGLMWSRTKGYSHMASAAVDTPFFPQDLVQQLVAGSGSAAIAVARSDGRPHPLFALWPVQLIAALRSFLGSGAKARVLAFIEEHEHVFVDFEPLDAPGYGSVDPFFNINTPADLHTAEEILGAMQ